MTTIFVQVIIVVLHNKGEIMSDNKWVIKDYNIQLMNLMARALEIELHNARIEGRLVNADNIEANLKVVGRLFHEKTTAFQKNLDELLEKV